MRKGPRDLLKLNIGGARFETTYSIIHSVEGSMLSAMLSGHALSKEDKGCHHIDRDGTHFRHVLDLLRFSTEFEVDLPAAELEELERELHFYGLYDAYKQARTIVVPEITATSVCGSGTCGTFFTVDGKQLGRQQGSKGWHVLLVYPGGNKIVKYHLGHTKNATPCSQLTSLLGGIPTGTIVALAMFDCGQDNYDTALIQAMVSCGGDGYAPSQTLSSFAMTGCKGMARGEAEEAVAAEDPEGYCVAVTRPQTVAYKW
jgi:hypothetical protein